MTTPRFWEWYFDKKRIIFSKGSERNSLPFELMSVLGYRSCPRRSYDTTDSVTLVISCLYASLCIGTLTTNLYHLVEFVRHEFIVCIDH